MTDGAAADRPSSRPSLRVYNITLFDALDPIAIQHGTCWTHSIVVGLQFCIHVVLMKFMAHPIRTALSGHDYRVFVSTFFSVKRTRNYSCLYLSVASLVLLHHASGKKLHQNHTAENISACNVNTSLRWDSRGEACERVSCVKNAAHFDPARESNDEVT